MSTVISFIPQSIAQESANSTAQYALQLKKLENEGVGKIQPVTYEIFYVTSKDQCDDSDNQHLIFYQVITDEYLSLYRLAHNQEYPACILIKDFDKYFSTISPTVIPIVIVDKNAGQKLLVQQGNNGLYTISGIGSESILVCACDNDTESWAGAWVLSHELSHLALYRYEAPYSVYFTWVHYNEAMSYACRILAQSNFCPEYSTVVTSPSGNQIPVMEIFGQGATAYNMPPTPPQIDVPILQQPIPETEVKKAVQIHVLPPTPALDIISSVEVIGLKPLSIGSKLYPVPYNITGGIIQAFYADPFTKKLTIEVIGGMNGGHLQLQLSRKIMESIQGGNDTRFVVNGEPFGDTNKKQLDYVETQTSTETRTLKINFPQDRSTIEITGTMIVPEFPLPAITLAISLGSLLAFYRIKLRK
ncbi:MAG TPA: hypothetical protein VFG24_00290 [Nitrosopumilaceae archaeon]|nr:hypothetical protein [Nitrosopumilaceae archaeon]